MICKYWKKFIEFHITFIVSTIFVQSIRHILLYFILLIILRIALRGVVSSTIWVLIVIVVSCMYVLALLIKHLWHLPDQNKYSIPEIEQKTLNIQLTEIKIAIILRILLAVILPCIIVYYIYYLHSMVDLTIQKNGKLSEKELISLMIITTSAVSAMVFMIYHYSLKKSNGIDDKQDKTTEFNTQIAQDAQKLVNLATSLTTDKNTFK